MAAVVIAALVGLGLGLLPWRIALSLVGAYVAVLIGLTFFAPSDIAAPFAYTAYVGFFVSPVVLIAFLIGRFLRKRFIEKPLPDPRDDDPNTAHRKRHR